MINPRIEACECLVCNYSTKEFGLKLCPRCGNPLVFRYSLRREDFEECDKEGVWRFRKLLPVLEGLSLGEGLTPSVPAERLAQRLGVAMLLLKNESLNPTSTFIDRGIAVDLALAYMLNYRKVISASTGDYAVSLATYAKRYNMELTIYVDKDVELGKLYRLYLVGANVSIVDDYQKGLERVLRWMHDKSYYVSIPASPTVIDGYRTLIFELKNIVLKGIDFIFVPVGEGVLISSIYKGLLELRDVYGVEIPRLVAVQLTHATPLAQPFVGPRSTEKARDKLKMLLDLAIERPLAYDLASKAIKDTDGTVVLVEEDEVFRSVLLLARDEGIITDPIGAVGLAGVLKLKELGYLDKSDKILVVLTGSPSKDPFVLLKALEKDSEIYAKTRISDEIPLISRPKLEILKVLAKQGPMHIYGLWKKLREEGLRLSLSTVFQHVKDLERLGLLTVVKREGRRIIYSLTDTGMEVIRRYCT